MPRCCAPLAVLDRGLLRVVLGDQLGHPHNRALLVENRRARDPDRGLQPRRHSSLKPRRTDAALHLSADAPPLRLEERPVAALHDNQRAGRTGVVSSAVN